MPLPFHFAAAVTPLHLAFVLFVVFGALLATARCWRHCFWWRWIGAWAGRIATEPAALGALRG